MKKIILIAVAAMMATMNVNAQDDLKNEIGVFYGVESASNILSIYSTMFAAAAGDQSSWWGPIGVEYYYHLSPVVAVGGVGVYAGCKAIDDKTKQKDLSETYITLMPSMKFNWLRKKYFGMYSALSAGVLFASVSTNEAAKRADSEAKDETITSFMFQATALGLEFGGSQLRGFVEAGLGEKGTLCGGLRYRF